MNVLKNQLSKPCKTTASHPARSVDTKSMPRVLLAEDCPITALSTKELLRQYGYDVTVEGNGNAALKTLSTSAFDFVLMDIEMPVMDGFEACRRLRSEASDYTNPSVPVIGMSANPTSLLRKIALKLGMYDVLEKPLDFDVLTNILRTLKDSPNPSEKETSNCHSQSELPTAVLDKEAALGRLAGDTTLYQKLLRQLRDVLPEKTHTLDQAIDREDFTTLEIVAHSLAGSFGSVGAQQCMQKAKRLCLTARSHEAHNLRNRYREFENVLEQFLDCLENELN